MSETTATFPEAFAIARERNMPVVIDITEGGGEYKVYPSGHCLCARTRPYHSFDGLTCDCGDVRGETIARIQI